MKFRWNNRDMARFGTLLDVGKFTDINKWMRNTNQKRTICSRANPEQHFTHSSAYMSYTPMRASSKIIIKRRSWPIRTSWLAEEKFENRNTAMPSIRFFCLLSRPPTTLLKILVPFNTNRPLVRSPQAHPHPLRKHVWVGDDFHAINKLYVSSWVFFFRATLHIGRRCWCR